MTVASGYKVAARQAKAEKMARLLVERYGADSRTAALLPDSHRRIVAELAGCRPPSDATWAVVVEVLAGMEAIPAAPIADEGDGCPRCARGVGPAHVPFTAGHAEHCSCNFCW